MRPVGGKKLAAHTRLLLTGKDGMGVKFENATETAEVDQAGKHQM